MAMVEAVSLENSGCSYTMMSDELAKFFKAPTVRGCSVSYKGHQGQPLIYNRTAVLMIQPKRTNIIRLPHHPISTSLAMSQHTQNSYGYYTSAYCVDEDRAIYGLGPNRELPSLCPNCKGNPREYEAYP